MDGGDARGREPHEILFILRSCTVFYYRVASWEPFHCFIVPPTLFIRGSTAGGFYPYL